MDKLIERGESDAVASRHASHYRAALEGARVRKPGAPIARTLSQYTDILGNVRAALEWSLSDRGHEELGTALAAAAAPLLLEMSLPSECRGWMERALSSLDESTRGTRREMELQVSLGESLMFTRGDSEQVRNAFSRGLELAETLGEPGFQLRVLGWLDSSLIRSGEFRGALEVGRRAEALAAQMDNPVALQMANAMLGGSLHLVGDIKGSEKHWRAALTDTGESHLISAARLGFDHRVHALCGQARNHWLMGCCDQAATVARCAIEQAESLGHPLTLCLALIWAGYVFLWRGDLSQEEDIVDRLSEYAAKHSLKPYQSVAVGLRGEVHVKRGRPELGIKHLRDGLQAARVDHYESRNVTLINSLAVGLNDTGRHAEAKAAIEEAMTLIERNGGALHMPETLRIKAEILISTPGTDPQLAEQCLFDAIECARRQSALSWELRATSSLARLLLKQDRIDAARQLLAPVYGRFAEGHNTDDLVAAKDLLVELGHLPR